MQRKYVQVTLLMPDDGPSSPYKRLKASHERHAADIPSESDYAMTLVMFAVQEEERAVKAEKLVASPKLIVTPEEAAREAAAAA